MSDKTKIGQLIDGYAVRDAIHVAVYPLVAKETLKPGEHIGKAGLKDPNKIGIVDPFLNDTVYEGEKFYIFLYPNTVTGMSHHWEHPAFDGRSDSVLPATPKEISESEQWLRDYCSAHYDYSSSYYFKDSEHAYQTMLAELRGGEVFYRGSDLHGFDELDEPDELKKHAEIVLGIKINWDEFTFTCTC